MPTAVRDGRKPERIHALPEKRNPLTASNAPTRNNAIETSALTTSM